MCVCVCVCVCVYNIVPKPAIMNMGTMRKFEVRFDRLNVYTV